MKNLLRLVPLLALTGVLCGCSVFEKDYVSVRDYVPAVEEQVGTEGRVTVHSYAALKSTLLGMAYAGQSHGSIVFDAAYDGDVSEDLTQACREVRTEDALCAYCVQNISFEINKVVTVNEAELTIGYSKRSEQPQNILHLGFSSEAEDAILRALREGNTRLTLLVARSGFSAEEMAAQVVRAYRANPTVVPQEPHAEVSVLSGAGSQRLYEISIDYGLSQESFRERQRKLARFAPFEGQALSGMSEVERAYSACRYLLDSCTITNDTAKNSAYSALIDGSANSEGVAFGYVELCRQLGIDCCIVYGQLNWQEHCWNIVRLGDSYYHVDITQCDLGGPALGFLRNDDSLWGVYRWDVASYPKCTDTRSFFDFFPPAVISSGDTTQQGENG